MFKKKWVSLLACLACVGTVFFADGDVVFAKKNQPEKIIYIPHDNRPVSDRQTADTIRQLGYDVEVPPAEILGSRRNNGDPDKLWRWLEDQVGVKKNAERKNNIKAVVISADSMVYGSLVASRKHEIPTNVLQERVNRFADFHKLHPELKTYVFSSIMRTSRNAEASGDMEPSYYKNYGSDIFRYTALTDKADMNGINGLTEREKKEKEFLASLIPNNVMKDWMGRREKNFSVNKAMINMTKLNNFTYYALGRDDNAPYSQTHMEGRHLSKYGSNDLSLSFRKFQNLAGVDEVGLLLLTRAVNDMHPNKNPMVYVKYNMGAGGMTVPAYSDEKIDDTVRAHIACAGGWYVNSPEKADLVLLVNTRFDGTTGEADKYENDGKPSMITRNFADMVEKSVKAGYPVGVADISYANGSDNALMNELKKRNLLMKLKSYAGWNTPTNSEGFALAQGMLARNMTEEAKNKLLLTRYLDDWAYQANVRQSIKRQLGWFKGKGLYSDLGTKQSDAQYSTNSWLRLFARDNLPPLPELGNIKSNYIWNRMFECDITFEKSRY